MKLIELGIDKMYIKDNTHKIKTYEPLEKTVTNKTDIWLTS